MKKIGLFLCMISVCLLTACGAPENISGKIVEVRIEEGIGVVSFVVQTDVDKNIGILMTDETYIYTFVDGITAEEFRAGAFGDVIVSVGHETLRHGLTTQSNQEITAYDAEEIQITGYFTGETATLADGTKLDIWEHSNADVYQLKDGTELLRVCHPSGPDNVYVGGIESFDDLEEKAQSNVLKFYENQGLLYDVQAELEKAYRFYLEKEDASQFSSCMIEQVIAPTAANERVMYFLTSVMLPIDGARTYVESRTGAAFDRKTGEVVHNWALFSCSPEEAKQAILDIAGVYDPVLRKEMELAFQPENIILFPDNMEICFLRGTLPSQENSYGLGLDYDHRLSSILHEWAIPQSSD